MSSSTEIANLALSHVGVGKEIANLETERSQESIACRKFYETARDATLRDFPWPFATKFALLGLVSSSDDDSHPTEEWAYIYRYPTDCVKIRRILSGTRNDTQATRVPYKIVRDASGFLVYTDQENAEIEYTFRDDDPSGYPSDFIIAFSYRLASYIAPRVTAGDPFKMGERALKMYMLEITGAAANSLNEEHGDLTPDSEFIRERDG